MHKILNHLRTDWYKYLLELIVITAGVLGAFSLNNWNEERLKWVEEKRILTNLEVEFKKSRVLLQKKVYLNQQSYHSAIEFMKLMGGTKEEIARINVDSLLFNIFPGTGDFLPAKNAIENIIQSGKLGLISNDRLIDRLYDWEAAVLGYINDEERGDDQNMQQLIPSLLPFISMKQMDQYADGLEWTGPTKLETNYYEAFHNLIIENHLDNYLFGMHRRIGLLKEMDSVITDIHLLIESSLTK